MLQLGNRKHIRKKQVGSRAAHAHKVHAAPAHHTAGRMSQQEGWLAPLLSTDQPTNQPTREKRDPAHLPSSSSLPANRRRRGSLPAVSAGVHACVRRPLAVCVCAHRGPHTTLLLYSHTHTHTPSQGQPQEGLRRSNTQTQARAVPASAQPPVPEQLPAQCCTRLHNAASQHKPAPGSACLFSWPPRPPQASHHPPGRGWRS